MVGGHTSHLPYISHGKNCNFLNFYMFLSLKQISRKIHILVIFSMAIFFLFSLTFSEKGLFLAVLCIVTYQSF